MIINWADFFKGTIFGMILGVAGTVGLLVYLGRLSLGF